MSEDINSTPLTGYKRSKKVLTPPLATLPNMMMSSWINDRLPEMIWAELIRERHSGSIGYAIFRDILGWLGENKGRYKLIGVTHTNIAKLNPQFRNKLLKHTVEQAGTDALRPLLLLPELPGYKAWKEALGNITPKPEEDWSHLADAVSLVIWHQSQEATDVRWVKLVGTLLSGKLHIPKEMFEGINHYPNKYDQRTVRPSIRSSEIMDNLQDNGYVWAEKFWGYTQSKTLCLPDPSKSKDNKIAQGYKGIITDKKFYGKRLEEIRQQLINHFFNTSTTTKVDSRHETVFGIVLYALDTYIENSILLTAGTVSGRATARIIFESYLTLKYLLHLERNGSPGWDSYRDYGSGQISLIERKYEDEGYVSGMVDLKTMDNIANEDKWSEFVPINLGNWDNSDLRKISIKIREKALYDKYYIYTSGYIHANWGAVREASMQTCFNPLHRLHRIPSFGLPILPSVNEDCRLVLNKLLRLVDSAYPDFKYRLRKRPVEMRGTDDGSD